MILFLYGQDTYRSRQKLQEIIEHYQKIHRSGLNLRYFEGEKLDYQDFKDVFQQAPMFQEKKLLVLKNVCQNAEFKNAFLENGKKLTAAKDFVIFYEEKEIPPSDPLFRFLAKNAKVQEFKPLAGQTLQDWAKKEFEASKTKIDQKALATLINYVGNDLWQFSNEIKKLAAFKNNKKIEIDDVRLLVRPKIETGIFKTIDAIAQKNKKEALALIHQHLEKGDSPLYLLAMINFQFRNLLMVKTSKNPRLHPYLIKKSTWQARKFTLQDLKKIYHRIFKADLAIKTGRLDPQTALDLLITEI